MEVEEAPSSWKLQLVAAEAKKRQGGEQSRDAPAGQKRTLGFPSCYMFSVVIGELDGQQSLYGHATDDEGHHQPKGDHHEAMVAAQLGAPYPAQVVGICDDGYWTDSKLTNEICPR